MSVIDDAARLLMGLDGHPDGRPANAHTNRAKWAFAELERRGLVVLSESRTGLVPDRDVWWVKPTASGLAEIDRLVRSRPKEAGVSP